MANSWNKVARTANYNYTEKLLALVDNIEQLLKIRRLMPALRKYVLIVTIANQEA